MMRRHTKEDCVSTEEEIEMMQLQSKEDQGSRTNSRVWKCQGGILARVSGVWSCWHPAFQLATSRVVREWVCVIRSCCFCAMLLWQPQDILQCICVFPLLLIGNGMDSAHVSMPPGQLNGATAALCDPWWTQVIAVFHRSSVAHYCHYKFPITYP